MAIPSREIGQPSSTKAQLLWNISKQLQSLTGVMGNISVTPGPGPEPTTTTTTTAAPGPAPAFTGTINVDTTTPGNEWFNFRVLSKDNGQYTSVTINWGDNTSEFYNIPPDSYIYFGHTYPSNGEWTVTVDFPDPSQLFSIDLDRNNNESPAVVTGYNFRDLNGISQLVLNNNDALHIAESTGLSTLVFFNATNADLESLSLIDGGNITNLSAEDNNLSVLDLTPATSLQYVYLSNNQLLSVDISDSPNINYLDLSNNAMSQAGIDAVLLSLVQNNQSNGYLDLRGSANDAPSSTGASLLSTLQARGWEAYANTASGTSTKLMYYAFGYSYNAKNTMFLNNYYFNNNVNQYFQWNIQNRPPKTVYYTGTFGPNTTMFTNPELTEFVVQQQNSWGYWMGVFVDGTLPEYPASVPGNIPIYSFDQYTGVILTELGTIADSTWTNQYVGVADNLSVYCDSTNNQWDSQSAYYPPGQNGPVVGGYAFRNVDQYSGNGQEAYQLTPVFKQTGGATKYLIDGNGLITGSTPCTYVPTWNVTWGATAQEAIDGTNPISIKPLDGTSMVTTRGIKKADGTQFSGLPGTLYIAYDGVVRVFNNYGAYEAYWNENYELQSITPPATPYQITLIKSSCCSCFNDPNPYWQNQKITAYSNFSQVGPGTPVYLDAVLNTPIDAYEYYTSGIAYFMRYPEYTYPSGNFQTCS